MYEFLDELNMDVIEFMDKYSDEIIELFETGSVTIEYQRKNYVLSIKVN